MARLGPGRGSGRRGVVLAALLPLASGLMACTTANELGGIWRGQPDQASVPLLYDVSDPKRDLGVELVLGHYGPDVTGLLRFYTDAAFELPRDPEAAEPECGCVFLHKGRFAATSGTLHFVTQGCLPGSSSTTVIATRARFAFVDDRLTGEIRVTQPGSPLLGVAATMTLARIAAGGEIEDSDLACRSYSAGGRGNPANGR